VITSDSPLTQATRIGEEKIVKNLLSASTILSLTARNAGKLFVASEDDTSGKATIVPQGKGKATAVQPVTMTQGKGKTTAALPVTTTKGKGKAAAAPDKAAAAPDKAAVAPTRPPPRRTKPLPRRTRQLSRRCLRQLRRYH
jgi:hypothetical protein